MWPEIIIRKPSAQFFTTVFFASTQNYARVLLLYGSHKAVDFQAFACLSKAVMTMRNDEWFMSNERLSDTIDSVVRNLIS